MLSRRLQGVNFSSLQKGYKARVITAPTQTIVSPTDLRTHCRIDQDITDFDSTLLLYQKAAEIKVENEAEIALRLQTREFWIEALPSPSIQGIVQLRIESPPVTAVNSVKYYDSASVQQTLDPSAYKVLLNGQPPVVAIDYYKLPVGLSLPYSSLAFRQLDEWTVNYTCGVAGGSPVTGPSTLPELAQLAIMELVAYWFRNVEAYTNGVGPKDGPYTSLIENLKWRGYP